MRHHYARVCVYWLYGRRGGSNLPRRQLTTTLRSRWNKVVRGIPQRLSSVLEDSFFSDLIVRRQKKNTFISSVLCSVHLAGIHVGGPGAPSCSWFLRLCSVMSRHALDHDSHCYGHSFIVDEKSYTCIGATRERLGSDLAVASSIHDRPWRSHTHAHVSLLPPISFLTHSEVCLSAAYLHIHRGAWLVAILRRDAIEIALAAPSGPAVIIIAKITFASLPGSIQFFWLFRVQVEPRSGTTL